MRFVQKRSFAVVSLSVLASLVNGCGGSSSTNSGGGGVTTPTPSMTNAWTWVRGAEADESVPSGWTNPWSEPYNSDPYYGTLGTPGPHTVPGGRNSSAFWTDAGGNFWVFGGDGLDGSPAPVEGLLNDLWKYSPTTNQWTWVGGSSVLSGASNSCSLAVVYCGFPGVYGTQGTPSSSNIPGGRELAVTWTDRAGNLWLFGGYGIDSAGTTGYLNDLWTFNPATKQWTWISGSNVEGTSPAGQEGFYGTQGVASAENVPPGLIQATGWIDKNDNLWLFGGSGIASPEGGVGYNFNNLWKFDPTTRMWTWISGNGGSENPDLGVYGTLGISAAGNIPPGRNGATSWIDSSGNMWLFGGYGVYPVSQGPPGQQGNLNDLWMFSTATGQWTWVAGTEGGVPNPFFSYGSPYAPPGNYGTRGVPSASNVPGGRSGANGWTDRSGNLWLFGGNGEDSVYGSGPLNDLWKFDPVAKEWTWISGSSLAWSSGIYGSQGAAASANVPGSRYNSASWMDRDGALWVFAGWGLIENPVGGSTVLNDLWRYQP